MVSRQNAKKDQKLEGKYSLEMADTTSDNQSAVDSRGSGEICST